MGGEVREVGLGLGSRFCRWGLKGGRTGCRLRGRLGQCLMLLLSLSSSSDRLQI